MGLLIGLISVLLLGEQGVREMQGQPVSGAVRAHITFIN